MAQDDYAGNVGTQGSLKIGGTATGRLELAGDADWFSTRMTAGVLYELIATSPGNTRLQIGLFDDRGIRYAQQPSDAPFRFVAEEDNLFVGVKAADGSAVTDYALSLVALPDDHPANASTGAVLAPGAPARGRLETTADKDWFRITLDPAKAYSFTVSSTGQTPTLSIHNPDRPIGNDLFAVYRPDQPGVYYIQASGGSGDYVLSATELKDDIPDTGAGARPISIGAVVDSRIDHMRDIDVFAVRLADGDRIALQLSSSSESGKPVAEAAQARATLIAPEGATFIASNEAYTIVGGGTYLVRVSQGVYAEDMSPVRYSLAVKSLGGDDHADHAAAATPLPVGAAIEGALQTAGDRDLFKMSLKAGISYQFDLSGTLWPGSDGGAARQLQLQGPSGPGGALSFTAGGRAVFTPESGGDYYLTVASDGGRLASYSLRLGMAPDDYPATPATSGTLSVGGSANGVLGPGNGDRDWFSIELKAHVSYLFSATPSAQGRLDQAQLGVYNADGSPATVGGQWVKPGQAMEFIPNSDGKYFLSVGSSYNEGGYTVSAALGQADDVGDSTASATPVAAGTLVRGRFETADDTDVFRVDLIAGVSYRFDIHGVVNGALVPLPRLNSGVDIQGSPGLRWDDTYPIFKPTTTGAHYLVMKANTSWGSKEYGISYSLAEQDDYGDAMAQAAPLRLGSATGGAFQHRGDHDQFRINVQAGATYQVKLTANPSVQGETLSIVVRDGSYREKESRHLQDNATSFSFVAQETETLWFDLSAGAPGTYTLTVDGPPGQDAAAPRLTAQFPAPNASLPVDGALFFTFDEKIRYDTNHMKLIDAMGSELAFLTRQEAGSAFSVLPAKPLAAGSAYTLVFAQGAVQDLSGNLYAGPSEFSFRTASEPGQGGPGADRLTAYGNGAFLDGGSGTDVAVYAHGKAAYAVARSGDAFTVTLEGAAAGDTLRGIERLLFADGAIALDIDGAGGQAYRLYQAAFNRTPDASGLGFWIAQLDEGAPLRSVARAFVDSAEFRGMYGGAPSDAAFVELLYSNILHRQGEAAGVAFWNAALAAGAAREELLAEFSESAENQAALIGTIGNGFGYLPYG